MPSASVKEIIGEINSLGDADRLVLERELAKRLDRDWNVETAKARKTARRRKITQEVIDLAIERGRYGG